MDFVTAAQIVESSIRVVTKRGVPVDMYKTLEKAGLLDENRRALFREHVGRGVREVGHEIDTTAIPLEPYNTVHEVVLAVSALAGKPTTGNEI